MNTELNPPRRGPGRPPGFQGSSNRSIQYQCTECAKQATRETLFSKRVSWATIGSNPKVVRVRTIAWVCKTCMEADPNYQREPHSQAPGNKDIYAPAEEPQA